MKQVLLNFLIFSILWSNTTLGEFFKLPVLAGHFIEHRQRDPKITFIVFLSIHYWGKDLNDHDGDRDMKLPFKKISQSHHYVLFQKTNKTWQAQNKPKIISRNHDIQDHFFQNNYLDQLYRPPQVSV
ncbi:hypothetical protein [Pedobacter nototheniae]|uniref:hypothetical protein n=1 Tax=Pedobacter nototheniae TaxID=2488994 RepID=UPI0029306DA1|nr:hypothetical protein [Pedobacter nototheniae]